MQNLKINTQLLICSLIPPLGYIQFFNTFKRDPHQANNYLKAATLLPLILMSLYIGPQFIGHLTRYFYILRPEIVQQLTLAIQVIFIALYFNRIRVANITYIIFTLLVMAYPYYQGYLYK